MKTINSDEFRDMAAAAGVTTVGSQAMWLGGITFKPAESLALRLSTYDVSDVLGSTYMDAIWNTPVSQDMALKLSGQYMFQSSNGSALTGTSYDTYAAGLRADLSRGSWTLSTFYTQTGRGGNYQTPYGGWAGYTYMIVTDFNRAGETAWAIGGSYDFKTSLPGLSLTAYAVYGSDAVVAATGAPSTDKTEYDFTLDYRFGAERWPDWLRPLWLRFRYANVDEPSVGTTHDVRVIANWEWVFK
jgi:hypothetical protein